MFRRPSTYGLRKPGLEHYPVSSGKWGKCLNTTTPRFPLPTTLYARYGANKKKNNQKYLDFKIQNIAIYSIREQLLIKLYKTPSTRGQLKCYENSVFPAHPWTCPYNSLIVATPSTAFPTNFLKQCHLGVTMLTTPSREYSERITLFS